MKPMWAMLTKDNNVVTLVWSFKSVGYDELARTTLQHQNI